MVPFLFTVLGNVKIKGRARAGGRKRRSSDSDSEEEVKEEEVVVKRMKEEIITAPITMVGLTF